MFTCRRTTIIALMATLALAAAAQAGAEQRETLDGVSYIRNGSEPRDGIVHLHLQEQWRHGGEDDDTFFGMVTRVREDEAGNLYVMDAQLSRVQVFSPTGKLLRTLFGEGDGPGEVRGPRDMVLMADGRVGVVQEVPGKMIFVDRQGNPAGELNIGGPGVSRGGMCQTFNAFSGGDILLVAGFVQVPGETPTQIVQTNFLSRFDEQGVESAGICRTVNKIDVSDFVFDEKKHMASYWSNAAVGPDNLIYAVPAIDRYEIQVFDGQGRLAKVITREYQPRKRTASEREDFGAAVRAIYYGMPFEIGVDVAAHDPAILTQQGGLRVHPDGTIWVLTPQGVHDQAAGVMATFDVFDPDGEYARQVAVHGPWRGLDEGLFLFGEDHAVVISGYSDAMMAQFTGGNLAVELDGEAAAIEVIRCSVQR